MWDHNFSEKYLRSLANFDKMTASKHRCQRSRINYTNLETPGLEVGAPYFSNQVEMEQVLLRI